MVYDGRENNPLVKVWETQQDLNPLKLNDNTLSLISRQQVIANASNKFLTILIRSIPLINPYRKRFQHKVLVLIGV